MSGWQSNWTPARKGQHCISDKLKCVQQRKNNILHLKHADKLTTFAIVCHLSRHFTATLPPLYRHFTATFGRGTV